MNAPSQAPTVTDLMNDPLVKQAMEEAWIDSEVNDPGRRHEEGGWIYLDTVTGQITTQRAAAGTRALLRLGRPPILPGSIIVGTFHTHANPTAEGWFPGPGRTDQASAAASGVPWLIRAEDGIHSTGPVSRRGGLAGGPGFPP
jgi:hypothetical protein